MMRKRDSIKTAEKANNDSSVNTQRVQWLDSIRGVSFLIVIYVHCTFFDSMALRNYLMPVMLTSFFFVSGYLHKDVSFAKFLEQRTRTLYIPSVILGLFLVFTSWLLPIVSSSTDIKHEILGVIFQYDGYHHGVWFVAALYIYSILFYLMVRFMGGGKTPRIRYYLVHWKLVLLHFQWATTPLVSVSVRFFRLFHDSRLSLP